MAPMEIESVEPVKMKKDKKVKKEKKEKTSKKTKEVDSEAVLPEDLGVADDSMVVDEQAVDAASTPNPSNDDSTEVTTKKKRKSVAASANDEASGDDEIPEVPSAKKRKLSVEEIEVDINAPEPPSKKALRLLKKGKPLPPSKSSADTDTESKPKKPEVEKRSEHGIWIGNLPFHVSKTDLRTFFVEKSDLTEEMITRIHMPGPNDKKPANKVEEKKFGRAEHNKGFAYVDLSSEKGVELAVELSEELLSGRRVLIKDNKSFEGRPEKTKIETRRDGKPPNKRVFLGNLSYDVTEDSLKDHFEKCGAIESVMMATFQGTGKCKGYAWIVFEELEAAENAVRGYVLVDVESSDVSDSEDDSDEEPAKTAIKQKKKWWVNKIKGRPVRMEYAEDAQVRYKKRYGKDGTKAASAKPTEGSTEVKAPAVVVSKVVEYRKPYAARLTGGIVESKGKKTTF